MPISLRSENLKPMISVQNLLLRSMSLTFKTMCPIFLIFIGVFSSAIDFLLRWFANWVSKNQQSIMPSQTDGCLSWKGNQGKTLETPNIIVLHVICYFNAVSIFKNGGSI